MAGARGILVNITAGMDMAIGEFEEVGNIIKSFASENATVVVGTVIDPEMSEDLRVTVVATGLGLASQKEKHVRLVGAGRDGRVDYDRFKKPTVLRNQGRYAVGGASKTDMEYLDIPAFLRRQAD